MVMKILSIWLKGIYLFMHSLHLRAEMIFLCQFDENIFLGQSAFVVRLKLDNFWNQL